MRLLISKDAVDIPFQNGVRVGLISMKTATSAGRMTVDALPGKVMLATQYKRRKPVLSTPSKSPRPTRKFE